LSGLNCFIILCIFDKFRSPVGSTVFRNGTNHGEGDKDKDAGGKPQSPTPAPAPQPVPAQPVRVPQPHPAATPHPHPTPAEKDEGKPGVKGKDAPKDPPKPQHGK
jgi:hypothetical protein